jgi:hypothetical protein
MQINLKMLAIKQKSIYFGILLLVILIFSIYAQQHDFPVLKGPYLGQKPPGMTPEIFAPGIVSTFAWEYSSTFTPDGKEFYYAISGAPFDVIIVMKEVNGKWTAPQVAPFCGRYSSYDTNLSSDGNKLYYTSKRPLYGKGEAKKDNDIWVVTRTESGWSEPKNLGLPVNTEGAENYPSITKTGTLYFHRYEKDGKKDSDVFYSKFENNRFAEPVRLSNSINSDYNEWDPFIAADESFIIFGSVNRPDSYGGCDLYISFRKEDGSWTKAVNMGNKINSRGHEFCPSVTSDGNYIFFMSSRILHKSYSDIPITYEQKIKILNNPGNGQGDIYWVSVKIIDELKPDEIK